MAQFIHLTDERLLTHIRRTGIAVHPRYDMPKGLFATPVIRNFQVSLQWLRELKASGVRTIGAVQFRLPDDEVVWAGRYNQVPTSMTAAEAVRFFMEHESGLGLEVYIPRKIQASEISRVFVPPQKVGWRYYPEAHGREPCGCETCQRGRIKSARLRQSYNA